MCRLTTSKVKGVYTSSEWPYFKVESLPSQLPPGSIALLLQNLSKNSLTSACLCSLKTMDFTDGDKGTHFQLLLNEKRKLHSAVKGA